MASVNKLLKKRKNQGETQHHNNTMPLQDNQSNGQQPTLQVDSKQQQLYEQYSEYSGSNCPSVGLSHGFLPSSMSVFNRAKIPISFFISPIASQGQMIQKPGSKIPRCIHCRAFMNCYNEIKKNSFNCFLCGRQSNLLNATAQQANIGATYPYYQACGIASDVEKPPPPETTIAFLIDLSASSFHCKMLDYMIDVMKQVLSRPQFDEVQILFFTYDEVVHEYDFSGQDIKCTILDNNIQQPGSKIGGTFIGDIREKLFELLDSLKQISKQNKRMGSNFTNAFSFVYQSVKHLAAKIFIFQSSDAVVGQANFQQINKSKKQQPNPQPKKSILQTDNKTFFNKYVAQMIADSVSCSFFIFSKMFKNIRVLADLSKLTNSEINLYQKDSYEDLLKFYYQLYQMLGGVYYNDVKMELMLSPGWYFTAVYSNLNRIKQAIMFKFCHYQLSKKICVCILPQENLVSLPYVVMQVATSYVYQRQSYLSVNTIVVPITSDVQKLYDNVNYQIAGATIFKSTLSSLRIEQLNAVRNKLVKQLSGIWLAAKAQYSNSPPDEIKSMVLGGLGILKSSHMQLDTINNTPILDKVVAERNIFQSCNYADISAYFNPFLFKISTMTQQMCRQDIQFQYPQMVELKFNEVKDGIFLMDAGTTIYLYISRSANPAQVKQLFGKEKFMKNQIMQQDMLKTDTFMGSQVTTLIRILRQQKTYGYIPLVIVRTGQNTYNQKLFYMNFYAEKYDEFRTYKMSLSEFITTLEQQNSF